MSGTITYEGGPLSGATVAAGSGTNCTSTNASGQYTCAVPPGWSGTVTPSMTDRVFTPASRSYTNVTAAQSAQDYTANATFYQVSGSVTLNGLALANVALAATGGPTCSSSNGAGQYSCTVPFGWTGSVTPSASGYSDCGTDDCVKNAAAGYPNPSVYDLGGPNSNTFASNVAMKCSLTVPARNFWTPGWGGAAAPAAPGYPQVPINTPPLPSIQGAPQDQFPGGG